MTFHSSRVLSRNFRGKLFIVFLGRSDSNASETSVFRDCFWAINETLEREFKAGGVGESPPLPPMDRTLSREGLIAT